MKTTCEHCVFRVNTGHTQVGCQLDRLVKFDAKLVGNHYEFEGYCNFCRNCYSDVAISEDPVAEVKKECEVKYGVIYNYDDDDDKLRETLNSCNGELPPVDVIVCYDDSIEKTIIEVYEIGRPIINNIQITKSIQDDMNWFNVYEMAMKKTKADFLYFCDAGEKIDKNCLSHLNSLINDELKSVYMVVGTGFTIVYKKLFEKFAYLEQPMQKLYAQLTKSEKLKDGVIKW